MRVSIKRASDPHGTPPIETTLHSLDDLIHLSSVEGNLIVGKTPAYDENPECKLFILIYDDYIE